MRPTNQGKERRGTRNPSADAPAAAQVTDAVCSRRAIVIQLYAITDHPGPPLPDVPPLTVVVRGGLAAICGSAPNAEETADMLWRHERVVETLMRDRDVLPLRYGVRAPDEDGAGALLEANRDQLRRSLDLVRGAAELCVRVLDAHGTPNRSRSKARSIVARADVADAVHSPLSELARAQMVRPVLPGEMLRAAYLVKQSAVERFATLVRQLQISYPSWQITLTGPGPPYSFATASPDQTGTAAGR
jgi:Gas vesicle synthesis protein GvpL/GvpF